MPGTGPGMTSRPSGFEPTESPIPISCRVSHKASRKPAALTATIPPSPREAVGRVGVGGASANSLPKEQADRPPTPDPSPPRARARGRRGAQRRNTLTPSLRAQAKQSILPHSLLAMPSRHTFAISRRDAPELCQDFLDPPK